MARRGENIYKRKDGRYEGRYVKEYTVSGKAIYGYIYSRNYNEVKTRLLKLKAEKKKLNNGSDILFDDWLKIWLSSQANLKPTTVQIYNSHIKNHISPHIGNMQIKKLNADTIQLFINKLELSPSTVKTIFSILNSALSAAAEKGYITDTHRKIRVPKKEKSIVKILSLNEQHLLEKVLLNDEDTGVLICLYTGLRIGELCALKWRDIDFENALLTVNGTQIRTKNGLEISSPKSRMSKREIPIPQFLLNKLKAMSKKSAFVISKNSKQYDLRTYRNHFKRLLKKANLPDIKFHSLRHTFATRALEVGMDYKTLSELLGHASVGITLDLYAHSLNEHKRKEMDKLSELYLK